MSPLRRTPVGAAVLVAAALLTSCSGGDDTAGRSTSPPTSPATSSASPTPSATPSPLPAVFTNPQPCQTSFTCARFEVPLNRARPTGIKLQLQVAAETDPAAPRGVLLYLAGGPGDAAVPTAGQLLTRLGPEVVAAYRVVVVDTRGTGPTALRCDDLQTTTTPDLTPDREALRGCARSLGPRRSYYSTSDTVVDLEAIRSALGAEKMTIDAVDYGTFVAQQYAIAHPTRIRALVLDSVVPYNLTDPLERTVMHASRRVLTAACAAVKCAGDPLADIEEVTRRDRNGPALFETVKAMSSVDPTYKNFLLAVHESVAGKSARLQGIVHAYRVGQVSDLAVYSAGTHAAASCADQTFPWGRADAPGGDRLPAVRKAMYSHKPVDYLPWNRETARSRAQIRECAPWPAMTPPKVSRPVDLPAVPMLFLAGGRDLETPLEYTRAAEARAPRGTLAVFPDAGHVVTLHDEKARAAVRDFLLG